MTRLNLLCALICMTINASAATGRIIKVQGFLVTRNKTTAVIKDDKGSMNVPANTIDAEHSKIGDWTTVSVDFIDFYRLNPEKFKDVKPK